MPTGKLYMAKRAPITRKRNAKDVLNEQRPAEKNVMANASISSSTQSGNTTLNSKLHVLKQESLPSQMSLKPLCDTSSFQFSNDMKADAKESERALDDISSSIINVQ